MLKDLVLGLDLLSDVRLRGTQPFVLLVEVQEDLPKRLNLMNEFEILL
jgi:hypothetical protein